MSPKLSQAGRQCGIEAHLTLLTEYPKFLPRHFTNINLTNLTCFYRFHRLSLTYPGSLIHKTELHVSEGILSPFHDNLHFCQRALPSNS